MVEWLFEFLEKHDGAFVTAFFGLIGYLFIRWVKSRRPGLSPTARNLLHRLTNDSTHDVKGITVHRHRDMVNFWPFRVLEHDKVDFGLTYELEGEFMEVVQAIEEMLRKGYLTVEHESDGGTTVYRLEL